MSLYREEAAKYFHRKYGKSINGKELGRGISQRRSDGIYQARFVNRFGKRETFYAKTLSEIKQKLREEQANDVKEINVVTKDMTLDEWFKIWMNTCKCNCRNSTNVTYTTHYKRMKEALGWRKLTNLNLIVLQEAFNQMDSDEERKLSKRILVSMLDRAIDSDLLIKNPARSINTRITKEERQERKVLDAAHTRIFLEAIADRWYENLFVLALETGMRIGELCGLQWSDVDLSKKVLCVRHTLCYFSLDGKYTFELHDTKTKSGRRDIPLTSRAVAPLKAQRVQKQKLLLKGKQADEQYRDLVFVTKNNTPTQEFLVQECLISVIRQIRKEHPEFPRISPHCLRHTFATRAIENGMQPKTLQKILGHASLQLTMDLYCHVTNDSLFREMQKMEQAI